MDRVRGISEAELVRESVMRRPRRWSAREKAQIAQEAQRRPEGSCKRSYIPHIADLIAR